MVRASARCTLPFRLGLLLALGPVSVVFSAPAATGLGSSWLAPGAVDPSALLPAPPAADSLVQRAELEVLLHLQAERTPAQIARAKVVESEDVFVFGADVLGEWFTAANLPQTADFFAKVREEFVPINTAAKQLFKRRRPPYLDARIKPCVKYADTGSYPSGHGMQSAMWAGLLGAIFPEQADGFARRAGESRWCRLLAGVHNPSDVEAGRVVGEAIARELLKNPAVQQAGAAIRAEVQAHRPPVAEPVPAGK